MPSTPRVPIGDTAWTPDQLLAMVRECIARLPDAHPAKITRATVDSLRREAAALRSEGADLELAGKLERASALHGRAVRMTKVADALESYLTPGG